MVNWLAVWHFDSWEINKNYKVFGIDGYYKIKETGEYEVKRDENGIPIPKYENARKVSKGDYVVKYCTAKGNAPEDYKYSIIGIDEITSEKGNYYDGWNHCRTFYVEPLITPSKPIKLIKILDKLEFFKGYGPETEHPYWGSKIQGNNGIFPLSDNDFEEIKKYLSYSEEENEENNYVVKEEKKDSKHLEMVEWCHNLCRTFEFGGYIGKNESSKIDFSEMNESIELPAWMDDIASNQGLLRDIEQIDNIFYDIDRTFITPICIIECERKNNLDAVYRRFHAIKQLLFSDQLLKQIKPTFIIVADNPNQEKSYGNTINEKGIWNDFRSTYKIEIINKEDIKPPNISQRCVKIFHKIGK